MSGEKTAVEQLREVARLVRAAQKERGLSDSEMCRRYAGLGSTKTFKRILDLKDDLEELRIERQLSNYREAWTLIEMAGGDDDLNEALYDDFSDVAHARTAVAGALNEKGNTRLVIVEGNPGTGKTAICEMLEQRWPNVLVRAEASEIWKDSPMAMLRALLLAVGAREQRAKEDDRSKPSAEVMMPQCADERSQKLFEQLNERKLVLALDEAHHLGPRTLNLIKSLINQTPTVVVMLVIPTLLGRLTTKAYEEARQLTQNRLFARVKLRGPTGAEVLEMLERRGVTFTDSKTANDCGLKLAERAALGGNWKFVLLVCRKLRKCKVPIDGARFVEALHAVEKER